MDPIVWTPASWMVVDSDGRHRIELEKNHTIYFFKGQSNIQEIYVRGVAHENGETPKHKAI